MNRHASRKLKGFTLPEILLVIVIVALVLYGAMSYIQQRTLQQKVSRTAAQMKQILNAALSYYIQNGMWPPSLACLQGTGCAVTYLPANLRSPWGNQYGMMASPATVNPVYPAGILFYVWIEITSQTASGSARDIALEIEGKLPISYTTSAGGPNVGPAQETQPPCAANATSCWLVAMVNLPAQTLNNGKAVNFSGLYHNGGCVPVPQCPVDPVSGTAMIPQVFVAPVSVSGLNDYTPNPNSNVYPIESFAAYTTAASATPAACNETSPAQLAYNMANPTACPSASSPTGLYWRACLQIYTEKGLVSLGNSENTWGDLVTLLAITRCAVSTEPAGSAFTVYQ